MFGLFKKKTPQYSIQEVLNQLGACAGGIIDAASAKNDLEVAFQGAATITPILGESKKFLDLDVKPNTIFARYLIALQKQDLSEMIKMTRGMADALNQVSDIQHKGALIYFWFTGDE